MVTQLPPLGPGDMQMKPRMKSVGRGLSLLLLAHGASALVISGRCSRRGAIAGAFALGSLPTAPVLAQTEVQAAVAAREAAEAAERDPLNRLKGARVTLASITDQLSGENPDLGVVRAALSPSKPQRIAGAKWEKSVEGVAYAVRTYTKEVAFKENADVGPLRVQLLAQIKDIVTPSARAPGLLCSHAPHATLSNVHLRTPP